MADVRPIVLDAGCLISAEARGRTVWALYEETLESGQELIVTTPVLAQVWRDGLRQAVLARFLRRCVLSAPGEGVAKRAGDLLRRTGGSDAVDALVVATAVERGATMIFTTDPHDLKALVDATEVRVPPLVQEM
jgi:predicted nucleic acid-binding protein